LFNIQAILQNINNLALERIILVNIGNGGGKGNNDVLAEYL